MKKPPKNFRNTLESKTFNAQSSGFRFTEAHIGAFAGKEAAPALEFFGKGANTTGLTFGRFSLIDLIHEVLQRIGGGHVGVVTWSAGIKDAAQVRWMVDQKLIKSFRIVTDASFMTLRKKYVLPLGEMFGEEAIRTSNIHAKFTLIHNDEWKVLILSSMNLNANRKCENYILMEGDTPTFAFYQDFFNFHFDELTPGFEPSAGFVDDRLKEFFARYDKAQADDLLRKGMVAGQGDHWSRR